MNEDLKEEPVETYFNADMLYRQSQKSLKYEAKTIAPAPLLRKTRYTNVQSKFINDASTKSLIKQYDTLLDPNDTLTNFKISSKARLDRTIPKKQDKKSIMPKIIRKEVEEPISPIRVAIHEYKTKMLPKIEQANPINRVKGSLNHIKRVRKINSNATSTSILSAHSIGSNGTSPHELSHASFEEMDGSKAKNERSERVLRGKVAYKQEPSIAERSHQKSALSITGIAFNTQSSAAFIPHVDSTSSL